MECLLLHDDGDWWSGLLQLIITTAEIGGQTRSIRPLGSVGEPAGRNFVFYFIPL